MAKYRVTMLGGFSIAEEGGVSNAKINIAGRSRRLWLLVAYLIVHRARGISAQELVDLLWPDAESDNPLATLQNNVSRARLSLQKLGITNAKEAIRHEGGLYFWSAVSDTEVDAEEFDRLAKAAAAAEDEEEAIRCGLAAVDLYGGGFLTEAAYEPWVMTLNAWYHAQFMDTCRALARRLEGTGRWEELERVCRKAVEIDPSVEEFSVYLMRALMQHGAPKKAMEHYTFIQKLFMDTYGVNPSKEMDMVQAEAMRMLYGHELNENEIRKFLHEQGNEGGAFYCDSNVFREIVQLYARGMRRLEANAQIAILGLSGTDDPARQSVHMKQLEAALNAGLRSGDPFTKMSTTQFLILLPSATPENGKMVMDRIEAIFRRSHPRSPAKLHHMVFDLAAMEE